MNARREEAGLSLIAIDEKLAEAAADRAHYFDLNRAGTRRPSRRIATTSNTYVTPERRSTSSRNSDNVFPSRKWCQSVRLKGRFSTTVFPQQCKV
ncbi:hypothetical protein [Paraburkholderia caledonica]|uniref:hypothetical protein n=1 Tax=Paraburkholderia caledonica TaxID=134536 RepID=UPI0038BA4983